MISIQQKDLSRTPAMDSRLVVRAWLDPEFKSSLLKDGVAAEEIGGTTCNEKISITERLLYP